MKRTVSNLAAIAGLLAVTVSVYGTDAKRVYFPDIDDKSIFVVVETGNDRKSQLSVAGVLLKPKSDAYIEMVNEGYLSGVLSPDKARILVSLGHVDEKNVWVVNLKAKQLEFASHDNPARHVFPKWLSSSSFELMYGGMGYRVEREYKLVDGSWKITRDQTIEDE